MRAVVAITAGAALFLLGFATGRRGGPSSTAAETAGPEGTGLASASSMSRRDDGPGRRDRRNVAKRGKLLEGKELGEGVRRMLGDWKEDEIDLLAPAGQVVPSRQPLFDVVTFHRLVTSMSHATPAELEDIRTSFREQADDSIFAAIWGSTLEFQCLARELEVEGSVALDRALANARMKSESEDEDLVSLPSLVFAYARIAPENARRWVESAIADGRPLPEGSTAEFLRAALERAESSDP